MGREQNRQRNQVSGAVVPAGLSCGRRPPIGTREPAWHCCNDPIADDSEGQQAQMNECATEKPGTYGRRGVDDSSADALSPRCHDSSIEDGGRRQGKRPPRTSGDLRGRGRPSPARGSPPLPLTPQDLGPNGVSGRGPQTNSECPFEKEKL